MIAVYQNVAFGKLRFFIALTPSTMLEEFNLAQARLRLSEGRVGAEPSYFAGLRFSLPHHDVVSAHFFNHAGLAAMRIIPHIRKCVPEDVTYNRGDDD